MDMRNGVEKIWIWTYTDKDDTDNESDASSEYKKKINKKWKTGSEMSIFISSH